MSLHSLDHICPNWKNSLAFLDLEALAFVGYGWQWFLPKTRLSHNLISSLSLRGISMTILLFAICRIMPKWMWQKWLCHVYRLLSILEFINKTKLFTLSHYVLGTSFDGITLIYNLYNLQNLILVMTTLPSPIASVRK